jgi:hypothetical protein
MRFGSVEAREDSEERRGEGPRCKKEAKEEPLSEARAAAAVGVPTPAHREGVCRNAIGSGRACLLRRSHTQVRRDWRNGGLPIGELGRSSRHKEEQGSV